MNEKINSLFIIWWEIIFYCLCFFYLNIFIRLYFVSCFWWKSLPNIFEFFSKISFLQTSKIFIKRDEIRSDWKTKFFSAKNWSVWSEKNFRKKNGKISRKRKTQQKIFLGMKRDLFEFFLSKKFFGGNSSFFFYWENFEKKIGNIF